MRLIQYVRKPQVSWADENSRRGNAGAACGERSNGGSSAGSLADRRRLLGLEPDVVAALQGARSHEKGDSLFLEVCSELVSRSGVRIDALVLLRPVAVQLVQF